MAAGRHTAGASADKAAVRHTVGVPAGKAAGQHTAEGPAGKPADIRVAAVPLLPAKDLQERVPEQPRELPVKPVRQEQEPVPARVQVQVQVREREQEPVQEPVQVLPEQAVLLWAESETDRQLNCCFP